MILTHSHQVDGEIEGLELVEVGIVFDRLGSGARVVVEERTSNNQEE